MVLKNMLNELRTFDWGNLGDVETIGVWPSAVKFLLCAIVFVLFLGAGFWFDIRNLQTQLQVATAEEIRLSMEFEQKAFIAASLPDYKQQIEDMETAFSELLRQLPSQTEVPDLVDDITARGLGSGLAFARIELDPERALEFYIEQPIQVEVIGNYHDFGTFVSGVASLSRIVTLHDFSIKSNNNSSGLDMTITARTYRYRADAE